MALIAAVLVAIGSGIAFFALARTRQIVGSQPSAVEVALGESQPIDDNQTGGLPYRAIEPLVKLLAAVVRRLSPAARLEVIRRRIVYGGSESRTSVEVVLAYKALGAVAGALIGFVLSPGQIPRSVWVIAGAIGFSFIPDLLLDSKAKERQNRISQDLPEALDLLAITVEAGLGLEQGLELVVENLGGPLREEFSRLLREIELGVPRRQALSALRERTNVPELSSFIVSLIQADQMGVAVADVLKVQAEQVRLKRRQRAREKAAQTPVKILIPVIFFIFPTMFVVLIGPGAIQIVETLFR